MKRMVKRLLCAATTLFAVSYLFSLSPMKVQATEVPTGEDVYTVTDARFGAKGNDTEADAVAIQKALNLARETEATITVYIPDGTYYLDRFLIIYSDTRLVLADHAVIRRSPDYSAIMLINGADDTDVVGTSTTGGYGQCNNISIEGGAWDGTITGEVTSYDNLLYFGHADKVTVKDTTIKNVYGVHQLELTGVKNATVTNVAFSGFHASDNAEEDAFKEAIQLDSTTEIGSELYVPYDATPCKDVTVDNCTFDSTPCGIGSHSYVDNVYHSGVTITNNKFKNISNRLVTLTNYSNFWVANNLITSDTTVNNVVSIDVVNSAGSIENNNVGKATENGIYIMSGSNVKVSGNTISNTALSAIRVTGSTALIQGNTVSKTTKDAGIKAAENSSVQIIGNTVSDCAVTLIATEDVKGAIIKNNILKDATSSNGITIASSDSGTEITNNTITNVGEYPILIHGSAGTIVKGNTIDKFKTSGVYVTTGFATKVPCTAVQILGNIISNGASAVEFKETKYLTFSDNIVSGMSACPITIPASAEGTTITNNSITGNGKSKGITVFTGDASTIIGNNTIKNSSDYAIIIFGGKGLKVELNTLEGFSEYGIYLREAADGTVRAGGVTISQNEIKGGSAGIGIRKADETKITKNRTSGASKCAIYVADTCKNTVVTDNISSNAFLIFDTTAYQSGNEAGKNGLAQDANGTWYYYTNGEIDTSVTDLIYYNGSYYYVEKGKLNWNYTSLFRYKGSWYYVEKGKVNFAYNSLCKYGSAWYGITNGKVDFSFTGLKKYNGDWWYVQKGVVNFSARTLCQLGGTWWYVNGGKVDFKANNTLCSYGGKWWYIYNGYVNFKITTLCQYNGTWYYVENGAVKFGATTLCNYGGKWWYVEKGIVKFNATTLCQYNGSWWYVRNGAVDFSSTTLCLYGGKWWYVTGGKVNFSATTLCKYGSKWYYVNKGVVDFSYSGPVVYYGKTYTVKNGIMI